MFESRRLDLDRMAKNRLDLDLIVAVHPRSGGQGGSGAWGRRRATAGDPVRGGGTHRSPSPVAEDRRGWPIHRPKGQFDPDLGVGWTTHHA